MNFDQTAQQFIQALDRFLTQSRQKERPVINQASIPEIRESLDLDRHFRNGCLSGPALDQFLDQYLDHATRIHHPGYLAHQVGCPHPLAALGSLVDGLTNNAMAIYEMGVIIFLL